MAVVVKSILAWCNPGYSSVCVLLAHFNKAGGLLGKSSLNFVGLSSHQKMKHCLNVV